MKILDNFKNYNGSICWTEVVAWLTILFIIWIVAMTIINPSNNSSNYQEQPACGEYFCR